MDYCIIPLDNETSYMLPHPQQPFNISGRLIPLYDGSVWSYKIELYDSITEKTYPDESFDPSDYIDNENQAAFLSVYRGECVGSVRVCRRWNGNAFIDDLSIDAAHRRHGLGKLLMDAAVMWSREHNLNGVSLETQDNNIAACMFYLNYGYVIGGIDTKSYTHPSYRGETALYFYLRDDIYYNKK